MKTETLAGGTKLTGPVARNTSMGVPRFNIFASPVGPRIYLEQEGTGTGGETAEQKAAREAAEKAAADKAAQEAADKAAREKAEKEKGSTLSDTEAKLLKEVMDKKDDLKKARDELKRYEGIDPDEYKRLKEAAEAAETAKREAEKKAAEAAGDTKRLMEMMAEEHKKEIERIQAESRQAVDALSAAQNQINELTIGNQFATSTYINEELVLTPTKARQIYGDHFERDEDGRVIAYDKPRGARERTKLVDGQGNPVGFEDALKRLVEADPDKERLIRSTMKTGTKSGTSGAPTTPKPAEVSGANRIALALAKKPLTTKK